MKCRNCNHNKQEHFVDKEGRFLRGKYKGEFNGENERFELFACNRVGCKCLGFESKEKSK